MLKLLALLLAMGMLVAACGGEDAADDEGDAEEPADDTEEPADGEEEPADGEEEPADGEDEEEPADGEDEAAAGGEIGIAWIPWEENITTAHLWQAILEQEGYDVTLSQYDVAPAFAAVAGGDEDVFLDMWLPATHASYEEEFGDQLEDYGAWFEGATLELTVPTYVAENEGITSLADLEGNADLFGGEIQGIEAGAGMMQILAEDVMPTYNLEDGYDVLEASTAAMRSELSNAVESEEPIVVTLWTPHPEYGLKDLTKLEDPEGAWGEPEQLHAVGTEGFSDEFPDVATALENWEMSGEELDPINAEINSADEGEWPDIAQTWVEDNQDLVDEWLGN